MDAWYHAAVTVTLFSARPSLAQFLPLLLSRGIPFFTVKKQLLSLPKFSKLATSTSFSAAVAAT